MCVYIYIYARFFGRASRGLESFSFLTYMPFMSCSHRGLMVLTIMVMMTIDDDDDEDYDDGRDDNDADNHEDDDDDDCRT